MKSSTLFAIMWPLLSGISSLAQTTAPLDDSQPATSNISGQQYPRIHSDLRASFRLKAPEAQKVRVHVDKFSYIGGFSGAGGGFGGGVIDVKTAHHGVMADAEAFNKKVKLVWLGIGTEEEKRMYDGVKGYRDALAKAGIKTVFYESPGTAHEWQTWRRCLREFAPRLF